MLFGDSPSFGPGDIIKMKTGYIGLTRCPDIYSKVIVESVIEPPGNPPAPDVEFAGPIEANLCNEISVYPVKVINDGKRGLAMDSWNIAKMQPDDPKVRALNLGLSAMHAAGVSRR